MENLYIFVLAIGFVAKFWQLFVFPFKYVGLGIFIIRDKSDVVIVSKKIFDNCQIKNGDKLAGFFINFSYIGYVKEIREHGNIENEIYILCTKSKYDELCKNPNQNNSEKNKSCDNTYYFRISLLKKKCTRKFQIKACRNDQLRWQVHSKNLAEMSSVQFASEAIFIFLSVQT